MTDLPTPRTPTLLDVIRAVVAADRAGLHTSIPGKVVSYDAAKQLANVQPMLKTRYVDSAGDDQVEALPVLSSVPVEFPRAGGYFISFPVAAGDGGEITFSEVAIAAWRDTGDISDPGDAGRHSIAGATFRPGLETAANALHDASATHMVLGKDQGTQIHIDATGVKIGSVTAAHPMVLGDVLLTWLTTHVHPVVGVTPGGGTVPSSPSILPTTGITSTKHKVDA